MAVVGLRFRDEALTLQALLNGLIQEGRYADAKALVRSLGLPYQAEEEALRSIDRAQEYAAHAEEWNRKVNDLLRQGDVQGAVRFVQSLDLPAAARDAAIAQIRKVAKNREAQARKAQEWIAEIARLMN
jgi:hypothetical protein